MTHDLNIPAMGRHGAPRITRTAPAAAVARAVGCLLAGLAALGAPTPVAALSSAWVLQTGPSVVIDTESLFSGFASAELAAGGMHGAGSYSYLGTASSSTRQGSLRVAATANGSDYPFINDRLVIKSSATFADEIWFSTSGPVTLRLAVQGSFAATAYGGGMSSRAELEVAGLPPSVAATSWNGGASTFNLNTHLHQHDTTLVSALPSNYIVWLERSFNAVAAVHYQVESLLQVQVTPPQTGQAQALFNHTASLQLFMPKGMSFVSQSGDFLADAPPAVPEPGTVAMLTAGLLGVAWRVRARRGR
jgi:hypothetical protein